MDTLNNSEVNALMELAKNTIELKTKMSFFDKSVLLSNNKINKNVKMLIKFFYKPTNMLIDEIYTKGENNVAYEIVESSLTIFKKINENIFLKENLINDLDIEINVFSKLEPLGKNSIERLRNFEPNKHGIFIKYGIKEGFVFSTNNKNKLNKTRLLETACTKIGLPPYYWKQTKVNLFKFETKRYRMDESGKAILF